MFFFLKKKKKKNKEEEAIKTPYFVYMFAYVQKETEI